MQHIRNGGIAVAQQIAQVYQVNPKVAAVIVSGSVARDIADRYSDLEIGVFWHTSPTEQERKGVIAAVDSELWSFTTSATDSPALVSEHYGLRSIEISGQTYSGLIMIDTKHMTVQAVNRVLHDVLEEYETTPEKQIVLAAIEDAIPVFDTTLFTTWQARARAYPLRLAIKVIQEHLWFGPWFIPQAYMERDDQLVLHQHIVWMQQNLLKLLAGLNRRYYRSAEYKWIDATSATFSVAPVHLAARLKHILQSEPATSIEDMFSLIRETIALVEQHCPEVNQIPMFAEHPEITTTWARQRWEPQAPYSLLQIVGSALEA